MAIAEREPITGVCRRSPQRGQGQSSLSGVRALHPEAENILAVECPNEAANLLLLKYFQSIQ